MAAEKQSPTPWTTGKRYYRETGWKPTSGGFVATLDGRPLTTPDGRALVLKTERLAEAIAGEWAAQADRIGPDTLPLTRLACAVIDRVAADRQGVVDHVTGYGSTDLLCYRVGRPDALAKRQQAAWEPLLDWAARALGARLRVTDGIAPVPQSDDALAALVRAVERLDDLRLTALASATEVSGSLIIGLALVLGRIDADGAAQASQLDESWQTEKWGEDIDGLRRRQGLTRELAAAAEFLELTADRDADRPGT
jgi:chaperone required for assembly of F1-ATPase